MSLHVVMIVLSLIFIGVAACSLSVFCTKGSGVRKWFGMCCAIAASQ